MEHHRQPACDRLWRQLLDAQSPDRPARIEAELLQAILKLSLSESDYARLTAGDPKGNAELHGWMREIRQRHDGPGPLAPSALLGVAA